MIRGGLRMTKSAGRQTSIIIYWPNNSFYSWKYIFFFFKIMNKFLFRILLSFPHERFLYFPKKILLHNCCKQRVKGRRVNAEFFKGAHQDFLVATWNRIFVRVTNEFIGELIDDLCNNIQNAHSSKRIERGFRKSSNKWWKKCLMNFFVTRWRRWRYFFSQLVTNFGRWKRKKLQWDQRRCLKIHFFF